MNASSAPMSSCATNLNRCARKKLHNFVKRRNNARFSVKRSVKGKISTRSARNRGEKTKKRSKSWKKKLIGSRKKKLIDSEVKNSFSN